LTEITKIEDLYQKDRLTDREPEVFRVTYTRRGSDVVIASTQDDEHVQITKVSHRGNKEFCYKYTVDEMQEIKGGVLNALAEGKFKIKHRPAPVASLTEAPVL